jgi:hypothetical protein
MFVVWDSYVVRLSNPNITMKTDSLLELAQNSARLIRPCSPCCLPTLRKIKLHFVFNWHEFEEWLTPHTYTTHQLLSEDEIFELPQRIYECFCRTLDSVTVGYKVLFEARLFQLSKRPVDEDAVRSLTARDYRLLTTELKSNIEVHPRSRNYIIYRGTPSVGPYSLHGVDLEVWKAGYFEAEAYDYIVYRATRDPFELEGSVLSEAFHRDD